MMGLFHERARLARRVSTFIASSLDGTTSEPFAALALDIHGFQVRHDPVQRALAEGMAPSDWRSLPAVPVDLFKDLPVGTVADDAAAVVFRTSGTTQARRGEHRLRDTSLYDQGARAWHRRCVPAAPSRVVALLQDPAIAPDSSLSHMVAGFGDVSWFVGADGLDAPAVGTALQGPGPVYVCATAFALAELLEHGVQPLATGSVVMVTGGFKGRRSDLSEADLSDQIQTRLAPDRLVREYGMTELSSQLWADVRGPYRPPPWLRPVAVDPASGVPLDPGQTGQLRFVDLCNLDSAVAIETLDQGTVHDDGSLTLLGRLPGAEVRGCSLTVEELQRRREGR